MDWGQAVVQVIVVLLGGGVGVSTISYLLTRNKVRAEAAQIATSTSIDYNAQLYDRLTAENERLSKRQDNLESDSEVKDERIRYLEQYAWRSLSWMTRAYDGIQQLIKGGQFSIEPPPELKLPDRQTKITRP